MLWRGDDNGQVIIEFVPWMAAMVAAMAAFMDDLMEFVERFL